MSNNPGKKGKPAPWERRAAEHRAGALEDFRLANHAAYADWSRRRSEAHRSFREESSERFGMSKEADRRLGAWEKKNPNPMSWEEYKRLEAEFAAQYVPVDHS